MESITFEQLTEETLYIALEIVNSNSVYNLLVHNKEKKTIEEVKDEFVIKETKTIFVKLDDTYIGLIGFMENHNDDACLWLELLMIHRDYQGYGFGSLAYSLFEQQWANNVVRTGVLEENKSAKAFLEKKGFGNFQTVVNENGKEVCCYEKRLKEHF